VPGFEAKADVTRTFTLGEFNREVREIICAIARGSCIASVITHPDLMRADMRLFRREV
jgi:hypothetical protein